MRKIRLNLAGPAILAMHCAFPFALAGAAAGTGPDPLPDLLEDTGLFVPGSTALHPDVISYTPQYPLWSDGAVKRRWLRLPPGTSIDASLGDAWDFPPGTRVWKEFRHGLAVETRYLERLGDGTWRFAAYIWNAEGTEARLAPQDGAELAVPSAPGGRYTVPSRNDCLACHEGAAVPVLGFSALQLSPDRDELAPHAERPAAQDLDLPALVARGLVANLPAELLQTPPRIAAATPLARAALGYLHANCGHCHNGSGPLLLVDMVLAQATAESSEAVLDSLVGRTSDFRARGLVTRVVPGSPEQSILALRMRSRSPLMQMPPLGTHIPDEEGIALIEDWIQHELTHQQELLQ